MINSAWTRLLFLMYMERVPYLSFTRITKYDKYQKEVYVCTQEIMSVWNYL